MTSSTQRFVIIGEHYTIEEHHKGQFRRCVRCGLRESFNTLSCQLKRGVVVHLNYPADPNTPPGEAPWNNPDSLDGAARHWQERGYAVTQVPGDGATHPRYRLCVLCSEDPDQPWPGTGPSLVPGVVAWIERDDPTGPLTVRTGDGQRVAELDYRDGYYILSRASAALTEARVSVSLADWTSVPVHAVDEGPRLVPNGSPVVWIAVDRTQADMATLRRLWPTLGDH